MSKSKFPIWIGGLGVLVAVIVLFSLIAVFRNDDSPPASDDVQIEDQPDNPSLEPNQPSPEITDSPVNPELEILTASETLQTNLSQLEVDQALESLGVQCLVNDATVEATEIIFSTSSACQFGATAYTRFSRADYVVVLNAFLLSCQTELLEINQRRDWPHLETEYYIFETDNPADYPHLAEALEGIEIKIRLNQTPCQNI